MANAHAAAVARALEVGDALGALFERMGDSEHPRGVVLSAYREARKAIHIGDLGAAHETLSFLRDGLQDDMRSLLQEAEQIADEQFAADAALYEDIDAGNASETASGIDEALAGWLGVVDAQSAGILALIALDAGAALILGDDVHAGLFTPLPVIQDGERWLALLLNGRYAQRVERGARNSRTVYLKQAVAAIDERTTDCCLRVHSQTQPVDRSFNLTGTPRYADRLPGPPFHSHCRTATALVRVEDAADSISTDMRRAADVEVDARQRTGRREVIHPAHARSSRS